jgi:hypothetical protein
VDNHQLHRHCPRSAKAAAECHDFTRYIGKAIDEPRYAQGRSGTRVAGHPVILSALFDGEGALRGLRFVTDPRAEPTERRMASLSPCRHQPLRSRGLECTDLPPSAGETPVGGIFLKQRCEKTTPERRLMLEAHLLPKRGQSDIDSATGEPKPGAFESSARFELFEPGIR